MVVEGWGRAEVVMVAVVTVAAVWVGRMVEAPREWVRVAMVDAMAVVTEAVVMVEVE